MDITTSDLDVRCYPKADISKPSMAAKCHKQTFGDDEFGRGRGPLYVAIPK